MRNLVGLYSLLMLTGPLSGEEAVIEMWRRQPGIYHDGSRVEKGEIFKLPVAKLNQVKTKLSDQQYAGEFEYEGQWLAGILAESKLKLTSENAVILHFENGMIVPVGLESPELPNIFFATKMKNGNAWTNAFKPAKRRHDYTKDASLINFGSNKPVFISVPSPTPQPTPAPEAQAKFSPWYYVDSLVGIEFVNTEAYERQFDFPGKRLERMEKGRKTFIKRCQYCHSVRRAGAEVGWDFVHPLPLYKKREKRDLYYHVKYNQGRPFDNGPGMPHQPDFTVAEANAIWEWMQAADKAKEKQLNAYQP